MKSKTKLKEQKKICMKNFCNALTFCKRISNSYVNMLLHAIAAIHQTLNDDVFKSHAKAQRLLNKYYKPTRTLADS